MGKTDFCGRCGGAALILIAAAMLAAAGGGAAHAAEPQGWYIGAGLGMSDVDLSESLWRDASVTEGSLDTGDVGYQVWGGYRLHPYFAIEGVPSISAKRSSVAARTASARYGTRASSRVAPGCVG